MAVSYADAPRTPAAGAVIYSLQLEADLSLLLLPLDLGSCKHLSILTCLQGGRAPVLDVPEASMWPMILEAPVVPEARPRFGALALRWLRLPYFGLESCRTMP